MGIVVKQTFEGFGQKVGLGNNPAIVVVDFINGFTDPQSPLGSNLDSEIKATKTLLDVAREKQIPIVFTTVSYEMNFDDGGYFVKKVPALKILVTGHESTFVDPRLGRIAEKEPVIVKKYASAFFGTHLHPLLNSLGIDTTIIVGCTTSGCIRASAIDSLQYGYRVIVPEQCVGDRYGIAHEANLYDINLKYGDVVQLQDLIRKLEGLTFITRQ